MAKESKKTLKVEETTNNDLEKVLETSEIEISETELLEGGKIETIIQEPDLPPHVFNDEIIEKEDNKKLGMVVGTVYNCNSLRLREGANIKTKPLAVIPFGTSVKVNLDNSTESFYEVTYQGEDNVILTGFCVKDFIKVG